MRDIEIINITKVLGTSPQRQSARFVNVANLFSRFCWWSGGKGRRLSTSQKTGGEVDGQAGQPRQPRPSRWLQQAGWCESWGQALWDLTFTRGGGCSKNLFQVFKKCFIFCWLNTFGKFLFGNVLCVVNVKVVMAVSSLEKGLINRNIGKEILKTFWRVSDQMNLFLT